MPTFYGVFGRENFHPRTGQNLRFHYVEIEAQDSSGAHAVMWEAFGRGWRDVHETKPAPMPAHPEVTEWVNVTGFTFLDAPGGAPFVKLPMPSPDRVRAGETVTLRIRLAEAMARESTLFVAGRCVAHRPGPGNPVAHGAGVWFEDNCWPREWNGARTFAIDGAGKVLVVRYVPKLDAEAAAKVDPENVSIVPETSCHAWLGIEPDGSMGRREISGLFTSDMLWALSRGAGTAWENFRDEARAALCAIEPVDDDDHAEVCDVRHGRVVGVRSVEGRPDEVSGPEEVSGLFDENMVANLAELGMGFERLRGEVRRARARVEALKCWRDRIVGFEVTEGRVVGVRMTSR